jgi:hypothetical protein
MVRCVFDTQRVAQPRIEPINSVPRKFGRGDPTKHRVVPILPRDATTSSLEFLDGGMEIVLGVLRFLVKFFDVLIRKLAPISIGRINFVPIGPVIVTELGPNEVQEESDVVGIVIRLLTSEHDPRGWP